MGCGRVEGGSARSPGPDSGGFHLRPFLLMTFFRKRLVLSGRVTRGPPLSEQRAWGLPRVRQIQGRGTALYTAQPAQDSAQLQVQGAPDRRSDLLEDALNSGRGSCHTHSYYRRSVEVEPAKGGDASRGVWEASKHGSVLLSPWRLHYTDPPH